MENSRVALNIDAKKKGGLIQEIDSSDFFRLGNQNCQRKDLFNFALALGYKRGYPKPVEKRESFIRKEVIGNDRYLYDSIFFKEKLEGKTENIDQIVEDNSVFDTVENYVNTGLDVLSEYKRDMGDENLVFKLIQEIDEAYKDFQEDFPDLKE